MSRSTAMPESLARRFMVLDSWELTEGRLRLRFVPDEFRADHEDPVLRVEVALTADEGEAERKISEVRPNLVDDIEVDESALSIWLENSDSPIRFVGPVTWSHEDYAIPDYIEAIRVLDMVRARQNDQVLQLNATINRTLGFIDRTIDRIEKKQDLIHPEDDRFTKQVQLLRTVRRQLRDD